MVRWLGILLGTLRSTVRTHRELALENLALRQQLAVFKAGQPRPRLTAMDRIFWVVRSRLWTSWRNSLQVVRPSTVVGWHRQGFKRYWTWKSRQSSLGCAEDPWRAAEAGLDGIAGDGVEVHAPGAAAAVAGVARVFEKPRQGWSRWISSRCPRRPFGSCSCLWCSATTGGGWCISMSPSIRPRGGPLGNWSRRPERCTAPGDPRL